MSAAAELSVDTGSQPARLETRAQGMRIEYLLAGTLVVAAILRLYQLDFQSLFRDEGQTLSHVSLGWDALLRTATEDGHPALYWIVLKLWSQLFGVSVWSLRLPSAIAGIVTCGLLVAVAHRFAGWRAGAAAGLLSAASVHLISASQEARPYALFGMLAVAGLWAVLALQEESSRGRQAAVAILAALLLYTDYYAIPLVGLALLAGGWPVRKAIAAGMVLWIPGALQMVAFAQGMDKLGYREMIGPLSASQTVSLILDVPTAIFSGGTGSNVARLALLALCVTALIALTVLATRRVRWGAILIAAATAASILLIWKNGVPSSAASRAAMLTPMVLAFVAVAAAEVPVRFGAPLALVLLAASSLDLVRGFHSTPTRGGWKQLAEFLQQSGEARPVYALAFQAPMLRYYYPVGQPWVGPSHVKGAFLFASDNPGAPAEFGAVSPRRFVNVYLFEVPSGDPAEGVAGADAAGGATNQR